MALSERRRTAPLPARAFPLATLLFFGSGLLGLGYELVWIRKAALVVGASQIAMSTVLTAFFLGLALGSYFFGNHARSARRSALLLYGLLEVGIGLYALAFPWLFRMVEVTYSAGYPIVAGFSPAVFGLRFVLLTLLFLVPTFFMGGTLPVLLDALVGTDRAIGSRTSFLYGMNILGAVVGVLLTGYFAIPHLGFDGTSRIGGISNLIIGAVALLAFRGLTPIHDRPGESIAMSRFFPTMAFCSGLLALGFQIGWARYFTLFHFSTTYMTAILLAVYLFALAVGSLLLAPLLRARWSPLQIVAWVQGLIPLAVVVSLKGWLLAEYRFKLATEATGSGGHRPLWTFELDHDHAGFWHFVNETADAIFFAPLFQVALVLLVPVVLMGAVLPALIAAATQRPSELRAVSGRLVFWNTLGASAGGFLCGYGLLPLLGLHRTLFVLGLGEIGLALATIAWTRRQEEKGRRSWSYALPGISLAALLAFVVMQEDITRSTIKHYLTFGDDASTLEFEEVKEGPLTTAYVTREKNTIRIGSGSVQMGHADLSGVNGQTVAGFMPVLFYSGSGLPKDCLGLCMGSGQSSGALLHYPIDSLDVVELSGEVMQLALEHMAPFNNHLADDPRVKLYLDDARHFIERAPDDSYDVISMEAPPPTSDGAYSLYTVEFFEEARRVLRPGGVLMHFLPLYFLTPADTLSVMKTMGEVFPYVFVGKFSLGDMILLGYPTRPRFDPDAIRSRAQPLAQEWISRGLAPRGWGPGSRHPIGSFEGVASMLVTGPEAIHGLEAPLIYRDDRPLLSYSSGDRWLARRYQGTPLTHISFTAVPITDYAQMAHYFDPPLDDRSVDVLTTERLATLRDFNVRDPREIELKRRAMRRTGDPARLANLALSIASDYDAALDKEQAFSNLGSVLEALQGRPDLVTEQQLSVVRKIVRNRIAVFDEVAERWIAAFRETYAGSPLLAAMQEELDGYRQRQEEVMARYLMPRKPGPTH